MSWLKAIGGFFKKFFSNTNWTHTAQTLIGVIAPIADRLIAQFAGAGVAAEVTAVINEVVSDLGTVSTLITSYQSGNTGVLSQIRSLVGGIADNVDGLITAGHIKSAESQADAQLVAQELKALLNAIPSN